jgi:hypothetical protein
MEYGEQQQGPYWLKSIVMDSYDAFLASGQDDDYESKPITSAGITTDPEHILTPEAKLLSAHFSGLSGWWYEVTVKREKPDGMCLKVDLESSLFDQEGYIFGGKDLGKWWISDIQAAEGKSQKAIETIHASLF